MDEKVQGFVNITGSTTSAAQFYLESARGDVAAAIDQFFADGGQGDDFEGQGLPPSRHQPPQAQPPPPPLQGSAPRPGPTVRASSSQARGNAGRIKGFGDLHGSDEESGSDDQNEYYTGGEKSGMVVKGGDGRPGSSRKADVDAYFDRLEEAGARRGRPEDLVQRSTGENAVFTGRVRRLGDDRGETELPSRGSSDAEPGRPREHTITFWRNNVFTVNDGEARDMLDPANRSFLEAISRGEAPQELLSQGQRTDIQVNCVRSNSDYVRPQRSIAFTGRGQTLSGQGPSHQAKVTQESSSGEVATREWEGIDPSQPSTSVQLRLADGSRMVAQFNRTHTVADIRRFIAASRPELSTNYSLMTAFPSAALQNESITLEAAGLLNAVIIQKTA